MELKKYQQAVLDDLDLYIEELDKQSTIKSAFRSYWANKGISVDSVESDYLRPYNDEITGVPNITIKVPTAGGKTYIACRALKHIFQIYSENKPKVVVWFVPSDPILKQTYNNLRNPNHPYRHALDIDFANRVNVVNKESALVGENIHPTQLKENLTILVLSVQSFASNNKDGRKARRENENLAEHVSSYTYSDKMLTNADETSLLQVIAQLNPVMVIDESHNFESSELRIDLKKEINPSFIFNLTATPKENSNIISFVDAMQLKMGNMVKLPVIVYNHKTTTDVIANAIALQRSLESKAKKQQEEGGKYIRPIVLFQAQPKIADDNITFEKIKEKLIEGGIPEEQVKIKTANKDEIKNINLMSESCEVRYIITVNALKEGWDCPFAYILASLANKSSKIDVEQILGRVLRLPYTKKQSEELLNLSYVFTCSADFQDTLSRIVESLNNAGFSKRDFRVANSSQENTSESSIDNEEPNSFFQPSLFTTSPTESIPPIPKQTKPQNETDSTIEETVETNISEIQTETIRQSVENSTKDNNEVLQSLESSAIQQSNDYNESIEKNDGEVDNPIAAATSMNNKYKIKPVFESAAQEIRLPIFVQKTENFSVFGTESVFSRIEKSDLLEGIDLSLEDHKIDFTRSVAEVEQIDLASDYADGTDSVPVHKQLNMKQLEYLKKQLLTIPPEGKKKQLAGTIASKLNIQEVSDKMLTQYIYDCIQNMDNDAIDDLITFQLQTIDTIKTKINTILDNYRYNTFKDWLDLGKIRFAEEEVYTMPKQITLLNKMIGIAKGLYKEEEKVNDFESKVISAISNEDNVYFWHRNQERGKGFFINGFINHYPDFIVKLKSGQTLLIETKGDDRDNSDSARKLELGTAWANKAGSQYRYYMVFDKKAMDGAITIKDLLGKIEQLGCI
ncbi:type III restriction endonuclease subunit R [Phocaeicola vulgatus]|uniref:DEAD/DEAH box helicase family protein n=1 Tax=Phocaeicola vulgatus TaxID=821 RepID=UPI000E551387|nr:DEAD/DEAH box helicase family protein [Phocaeicola vulgatus]RHB87416.1 type III restriction endonuclease subunit R [Phocaeicola vulgatus]